MAKKKKTKPLLNINSDAFVQGVGERSIPGNLGLDKLVEEIITNTFMLRDLNENYFRLTGKYTSHMQPDWEQVRAALENRNKRLYTELHRREQKYFFGKGKEASGDFSE